ncbi:MAG: Kelch repeat-containing protein [Fimbriiglobus sp.]
MPIHRFLLGLSLAFLGLTSFVSGQEPTAKWPPLPTPVSSLGAVESEGYLYIYGGHAGKTHTYSTQDVIGTFHRLKLDGGTKWEELPGGPILQGMNLAAHGGKVYRVGGMKPRNESGQPSDNVSVVDAARFDPKVGKWESLPPLLAGRSSHDLVIAGDKLVVVGGWQSRGRGVKQVWHDTTVILDLTAKEPAWRDVPQPFQRRALTATAIGTKVYVMCGLDAKADAFNRVDVLDVVTEKWTTAPDVPGGRIGFSPAATTVNGRLVINTSEGNVFRLSEDGLGWEKVGTSPTKRIVHRLVPHGQQVLLVGGAFLGGGGNAADLESITLADKGEKVDTKK